MCEVFSDGDPAVVWDERHRVARKQHVCDGCGARIAPGEKYLVHCSIMDRGDTPYSNKMCAACEADRELLAAAHDGEFCPIPEYLRDAVQRCINEGGAESEERWRPMLARIDARKAPAP